MPRPGSRAKRPVRANRLRAAAALALAALPAPALAQAWQCSLPDSLSTPAPPRQDGPERRVPISGFTLAASWSPEFCQTHRDAGGSMQCSGRYGRFGFVLHGLWGEARFGGSPQWCGRPSRPAGELLRRNLCMTPSPGLLEHEWAKHGSCMARTPEAYFRMGSALWSSLRWPDADRLSRQQGLTVRDLKLAFVAVNPGWKPAELAVELSGRGWLREVQLCYGRDFLSAPCPRGRGAPDSAPMKIWRGM